MPDDPDPVRTGNGFFAPTGVGFGRSRPRIFPDVLPALNYAALGLETFRDDILVPAAILAREPLSIEVAHLDPAKPDLRLSAAEAARLRFRPVELGYRWGPVWSTAWFRLRGKVPASMRGKRVSLRFSSGTEATLWRDGVPFAGFDPYHDLVPIVAKARGSERVEFLGSRLQPAARHLDVLVGGSRAPRPLEGSEARPRRERGTRRPRRRGVAVRAGV